MLTVPTSPSLTALTALMEAWIARTRTEEASGFNKVVVKRGLIEDSHSRGLSVLPQIDLISGDNNNGCFKSFGAGDYGDGDGDSDSERGFKGVLASCPGAGDSDPTRGFKGVVASCPGAGRILQGLLLRW